MNFKNAAAVEQVVWNMRLADRPRGENRSEINRLFNGFAPWTESEAEEAGIKTNVNFLDAPKLAADARRSYYNAFLKPSVFFNVTLDGGPNNKRGEWSSVISKEINRVMRGSRAYFEGMRSKIASTVLHGIGPVNWTDDQHWNPRALGVEDLMIPSNTLLSIENLTHFAIFRKYTAPELQDIIERKNMDPGWNKPLALRAIDWCVRQTQSHRSYAEILSPEKRQEQFKQDGLFYGTDAAPTIDVWDFFFYSNDARKTGWRRRIILDTPASGEVGVGAKIPEKNLIGDSTRTSDWLYDGGNRVYASKISEILHFQFGDLSAVSPFKYHSVRSLGWLIYAVCHLQNRLRCKLNDAVFENLLQYFRVGNPDDHERLTKIVLHNYGILPEGVEFVKQQDRWQVNPNLVQECKLDNQNMLNEAAAQFREGRNSGQQQGNPKTATEIMAEVNAANALVGSMLLLAYTYETYAYQEIARRFCIPNSQDIEVQEFRKRVLKKGVDAKMLDIDYWQIEPEKVLGSGNKMLQIAMADKLMAVRPLLDPDAQREAVRVYVAANSDDPELANRWVSDKPITATESVHDAQTMIGSIMNGVSIAPRAGQDPGQMVQALLVGMAEIIKRIGATTKLPTTSEFAGLINLGKTIEGYNQQLAQDKASEDKAKENEKLLAGVGKIVAQWGQELKKQQAQPAGAAQGAMDAANEAATAQVKNKALLIQASTKAKIAQASASQKAQQRQEAHMAKLKQQEESHIAGLRKTLRDTDVQTTIADAKAATEITNARKKAEADAEAAKNKPAKKKE